MRAVEAEQGAFHVCEMPVTTHDEQKDNTMTISWTMGMDFTPVFAGAGKIRQSALDQGVPRQHGVQGHRRH